MFAAQVLNKFEKKRKWRALEKEVNAEQWLQRQSLSLQTLQQGLHKMAFVGIDDGDIYLQKIHSETWALAEEKIKTANYSSHCGLGVRAISGEKTSFAYADGIDENLLEDACNYASKLGRRALPVEKKINCTPIAVIARYDDNDPLADLSAQEKVKMLQEIDAYARGKDARVIDVSASFSASYEEVFVIRLDGSYAVDIRPLTRFGVNVVLQEGNRRESAHSGGGGRNDYQHCLPLSTLKNFVDDALQQAQINLCAVAAPAGQMPVVLGAGWPGILLHEAVGHGLEGDFNRKGSSVFAKLMGERVCSPLCTIIDDGTLHARRGSLSVDDEGTASAKNVLIENGILKMYMQDRLNARLMAVAPTGNGRRESYAHLPMPRMTNTYLAPREDCREDMIKTIKKGIYAQQFGGGQVDITNGQFVFAATQAYLIENGRLTAPLKGATLIGNGLEVMQKISMVGHDLQLDSGIGTCGKNGQSVPVGVGQPSLKIDELTVGGTGT